MNDSLNDSLIDRIIVSGSKIHKYVPGAIDTFNIILGEILQHVKRNGNLEGEY